MLIKPHKYIFNRAWFEELEGAAELAEDEAEAGRFTDCDRADLLKVLTAFESNGRYESARATAHEDEAAIWRKQKELRSSMDAEPVLVPDEQRVEDAGLELEAVLQNK